MVAVLFTLPSAVTAETVTGRMLLPVISGRPELTAFVGHPGWINVFHEGYSRGASVRIQDDGTFEMEVPEKRSCLIVMFDRIETPPFIVPKWYNMRHLIY
jgi:hypothetical protein